MESTELKLFVLPDADEITRRLVAVNPDNHMQQKLYPLIARHAGDEKYGSGIVMMLAMDIHDYCEGMPPVMEPLVLMHLRRFAEALIGDDPEVLADAHAILDEVKKSETPTPATAS